VGNPSNISGRYAVLDFETTGLSPNSDRVVEVGIVVLDEDFRTVQELDSLVKVNRDLGPSHIHGIKAKWLTNAPSFAELAPQILEMISGKTIICHNATFDLNFLVAEMNRCDLRVSIEDFGYVCTRIAARSSGKFSDAKLATVAAEMGIPYQNAHSALADAKATAEVFKGLFATSQSYLKTGLIFENASGDDVSLSRDEASKVEPLSYIQRLVRSVNRAEGTGEENDYFDLLERALFDGVLSAGEIDSLLSLVQDSDMGINQVRACHNRYFNSICASAWADGVVSPSEESDIRRIGFLLGISEFEIEQSVVMPTQETQLVGVQVFQLLPGDLIVLTGSMTPNKSEIGAILEEMGFVIGENLTKKTKLLVAADVDSMSGKAAKAREYGVKIVEPEYVLKLHERARG